MHPTTAPSHHDTAADLAESLHNLLTAYTLIRPPSVSGLNAEQEQVVREAQDALKAWEEARR